MFLTAARPSSPHRPLIARKAQLVCRIVLSATLLISVSNPSDAQPAPNGTAIDRAAAAQAFGKARPAVGVQPDGLYICEAEEFQPVPQAATAPAAPAGSEPNAPAWRSGRFGENYYAATFANCFLSRKAFLGAPEQCDAPIAAAIQVDVKEAGRYLVLARYEAAYGFETQFRIEVEQAGKKAFDRLYGARANLKVWAFGEKLKTEVGWSWGAGENVVWEGHDAFVNLQPGRAVVRLIADKQPLPAARRNVDLVMLTTDVDQVMTRIDKEGYLPLDGMLTQSGDVYLRVKNLGAEPLTFSGKGAAGGGNWQQHSPYWVHQRNWQAPSVEVAAGQITDWIEVGGTMDTLADGQWFWTGNGKYQAEFGVKNAAGQIEPLATFTGEGDLALAGDADTRYMHRLRKQEDVLYDLLAHLKQVNPSKHGRAPVKTPIYAYTFDALDTGKHAAAVAEFKRLFALSDTKENAPGGRGYIDVRGVATEKLAEYCQQLGPNAANIAVVSLGDEIGLPTPSGDAANDAFRQWLQSRGLKPADIDPAAGGDWNKIAYNADPAIKGAKPGVYYWSKRYQYHFGIQSIKQRTDILRRHLPNAGIGANYSPHYPQEHMFLGEVFKWVSVFRDDGMTLPWSEDYIWQVPVGTPQMNNINLDLFRAANRHRPERKILYYVMPHMPNNTPDQWRRLFYGSLAHGMKSVNLFEFRPVHVAYTENHVDDPSMYVEVLGSFRELSLFEDIIQDGQVRAAETALWFSETGDIWGDSEGSFAAAKRGLYTAIRHQQIPLDFVVEQDALDGTLNKYKVLYLTDAHVSTAASENIAAWVNAGGTLFATAGAGMFDELNRPNVTLRKTLGVEQTALDAPADRQLIWIKQHLPFAEPLDFVVLGPSTSGQPMGGLVPQTAASSTSSPRGAASTQFAFSPVVAIRSQVKLAGAKVIANFTPYTSFQHAAQAAGGGSPKTITAMNMLAPDEKKPAAITDQIVGKGRAIYCAFLPSLSYYMPAIPLKPMDRGSSSDALVHFLPTEFDPAMATLIAAPAAGLVRPVECSEPFVETTVIESPAGAVIPLINWTRKPVPSMTVTVRIPLPAKPPRLASGRPVQTKTLDDGTRLYIFDLDVADALILR